MNQQFVKPNVDKEFAQEHYSIVHIASHGHFDSDAKKTFVLTFDSKLTLDDLEQLLRPSQLRDKPVELLTLSACQTAAGDDRAALGLAGIAIKAGARCAFATLWFVNDQSSATLVSDFYTELRDHPDISKAKALQAAQVKLLSDQRYAHPCYWAPYLIIGNWL
jgi:CHAT domain-containing protein